MNMSFLILGAAANPLEARRAFLGKSGLLLSGSAIALLAGREALAAKAGSSEASDVRILNTALGAELEAIAAYQRSEEHTSELQSRLHLVCRLLLEKKKTFIP